ncbi:hypothetical protein V5799_008697 [Amblyomma americanum]|uniref:Uncharacterized protein n=1 Tax=Amblyomma americanum TaxID=6943 RepID=A0AAQ4FE78_AMBAM
MDVIFQYMDKPNQPLLPLEIAPLMPYSDPLITDAVWQYRKGHIERKQQASEVQEMPQPVAMRDWSQAYPQHTQAFATTQKAWAAHSSNAESVTNKPVTSERRDSQSIREPRLIRLEGDPRESQQTRDPRQPFPLRDAPILSDLRTRWATQSSRPQPPRSQPSQAQSLQTQSSRPQPPGSQPLQAQPPEQQTLLAAIQMPYNTETSCPLCLVQIDTPESDRAQQGDAGLTPPQLETEDLLMALKGEESPNMMAYMQYYQRKYPNTRFWNPDLTAGQRDLTIVHLTVREHQRDRFLLITDVLRRAFPLLTPPNLTENQRAMLRIQLESLARRIYLLFLFPMLVPLCSAIAKYHLRTAQTKSREFAQKVKRVYAELGKSVLSVPLIDTKYLFTEQVRQEAASEPEAIPGEVPTVLTFDSQQQAVAIEDVAPNMDMQVPVCHHYRSSVVPAVGKEREASPARTGPAQYPPPGMPMHYPIQQPTQSSSPTTTTTTTQSLVVPETTNASANNRGTSDAVTARSGRRGANRAGGAAHESRDACEGGGDIGEPDRGVSGSRGACGGSGDFGEHARGVSHSRDTHKGGAAYREIDRGASDSRDVCGGSGDFGEHARGVAHSRDSRKGGGDSRESGRDVLSRPRRK